MLVKDMKAGDSGYITPWELIITPKGKVGVDQETEIDERGGGTATVRLVVSGDGKFGVELKAHEQLTVNGHRPQDLRLLD